MPADADDARWLDAAARLAARGRPMSRPNPAVGALIVGEGRVIGRGWTGQDGRPHAEAIALAQVGGAARGATLYVTLEPCAHASPRGPACADLVVASGLGRVVVGCVDPDPRTAGAGIARIAAAGIAVDRINSAACVDSLAGYLTRIRLGRPEVTLKLALSEDCRIARPPGAERWLTGPIARAHVHALRATMDAIVVGTGTLDVDDPRLDVRLPGLADRSPERWLLTRGTAPDGWRTLSAPAAIHDLGDAQYLMVEGGAATAQAFLAAGLVDRMMLYRAPLTIGGDGPALPQLAAAALASDASWRQIDSRPLGSDTLDVYQRG